MARKTTHKIRLMKKKGKKIVMLTSYDAPTAAILSEVGVDMILVGDSVGNSLLGYESTIPVTLEDVITVPQFLERDQIVSLWVICHSCLTRSVQSKLSRTVG